MPRSPLWRCPRCGHRFVTRNLWHSCAKHRIGDHFRGKSPVVRRIYQRFAALVRKCGPVTIYAQKTRIVCMVRVRFAGAVARKNALQCGLWLRRRPDHPAIARVEAFGPDSFGVLFRFTELSQLDSSFAALVREAYATKSGA